MNLKCLVTGAAGFIGSHLSGRLAAEGYEVIGVNCFTDYYRRMAMMRNRKTFAFTAAFLCCLLLAGAVWAMSSANYAIQWDVIGSGGGPTSSASYVLKSTVGQAAIGASHSASYRLGAGYWYGVTALVPLPSAAYRIHLPIVMKQYTP